VSAFLGEGCGLETQRGKVPASHKNAADQVKNPRAAFVRFASAISHDFSPPYPCAKMKPFQPLFVVATKENWGWPLPVRRHSPPEDPFFLSMLFPADGNFGCRVAHQPPPPVGVGKQKNPLPKGRRVW
jgi:hypothetical protein